MLIVAQYWLSASYSQHKLIIYAINSGHAHMASRSRRMRSRNLQLAQRLAVECFSDVAMYIVAIIELKGSFIC